MREPTPTPTWRITASCGYRKASEETTVPPRCLGGFSLSTPTWLRGKCRGTVHAEPRLRESVSSGCIAVLAPNTSSRTQIHPMGARYSCWLLLGVFLRESVPAEESAGQGQKRLVYVCPFLIANSQAAELIQPSECPLHYPAPSPQPTAMFGVALRKKRHDMSAPQTLPNCLRVIATVA